MLKPLILVIVGPTASGKTDLAYFLAKELETEIVSADSRQCYKELNIGVAKPSFEYLKTIPHHFINSHSIFEELSAFEYGKLARNILKTIFTQKNLAIVVGGSGLYIQALCNPLNEIPTILSEIKTKVSNLYKEKGLIGLQKTLAEIDPNCLNKIDINNERRLTRAIEVKWQTGNSIISYWQKETENLPYQIVYLGLKWEKTILYNRINLRVEKMIQNGLEEEVYNLLPHKHLKSLQTVGYKELFSFFDGEISRKVAIDKIKQHSRNYAKRQLTWFNKLNNIIWLDKLDSFFQQNIGKNT